MARTVLKHHVGTDVRAELPLVSVVIPTYNYARFLDQAIQSVLYQSYPNIQLIVLDDGSTDNTVEVLEKYAGRFYWERHENLGQAETINKGWRMSKGSILAYLSPDDVLLPNAVEVSVEHLLSNDDVVLTYCDYDLMTLNSAVIRRVAAPEFDYREMVVKFVCPPGPGAFLKREAAEAAGLWDDSLRQIPDYDYWLRLGLQGRFLKINEVLARFRVHGGSQSFSVADERKSEEYVRVIENFYRAKALPPNVLDSKAEAMSNAHVVSARSHLRSGRYVEGLRHLSRSVSLYPKNLFSLRTFKFIAHGLFNHLRYRDV